ncbi:MAG: TSUP family transporter, partial [Candidatus Binatia bacterium]
MLDESLVFFLVLVMGAAGQFLDGTLGMGFGVFSASMMLAAGFTPVTVVSTVNMAKVVTGLFTAVAHFKADNIRRAWLLPLIVPGVIGG